MKRKKRKKLKNAERGKKLDALIFPSLGAFVFLALMVFIVFQAGLTPRGQILVSSDSPKQGETILVKISGKYAAVSGSFNGYALVFMKNTAFSDWTAFLGIDANLEPGEYKISVFTPAEALEKQISVKKADFATVKMAISQELIAKGYTERSISANIIKNDNPVLNQILEKFTPQAYFEGGFSSPLAETQISGFDFGEFVKTGALQMQHFGVDLRAGPGTEVFAANSGKVVLTKELSNYGKTIIIDHGLGIFSLYLHLSEYKVSEDQFVQNGQIIGLSGSTGYSVAPHLHFSIRDNNSRVNPILFIKTTQKANTNPALAGLEKIFSTLWAKF